LNCFAILSAKCPQHRNDHKVVIVVSNKYFWSWLHGKMINQLAAGISVMDVKGIDAARNYSYLLKFVFFTCKGV
jgi:hypothetical protein